MPWSENDPTYPQGLIGHLQPNEVLYFFDGPVLFTIKMGLFSLLVYKVDETDEADLFVLKQVSDTEIARLKNGRLSLLGALQADYYWLIETKGRLEATRTSRISVEDLPDTFLPLPGLGLAAGQTRLPDTLSQSDAFFSVRFTGDALQRGQMSFRLFKDLTDRFFSASINLLRPQAMAGLRSRDIFDFPIMEPKFASLMVALQQPNIDTEMVNKRNQMRGVAPSSNYLDDTYKRRKVFFDAFGEVASEAQRGLITEASTAQHFMLLDTIAGLLPSEDNAVRTTEFSANGELAREHVRLDSRSGQILRQAFLEAKTKPLDVTGRIELINGHASTFVLRDLVSRRAVTCSLRPEWFRRFDEAGGLRYGSIAKVHGDFQRRTNRDWLVVQREPESVDLTDKNPDLLA